ncbi:MAG: CopG family transcriptional regulator [bacterium]|nr:CopG family transcriptional regulator [bacterium]
MSALTRRATVYLKPASHKVPHLQFNETSRSISEPNNDAVRDQPAEDAKDPAVFDERADEPAVGFEEFAKGLKRNGTIGFARRMPS